MALSEKMQDRVSYHTQRSFELLDQADRLYLNPGNSASWPLSTTVQLAQAHMQMLLLLKEMEE